MSKSNLKVQAIKLRKEGYSYSFILEKVPVSKGTLSFWLSQIPYTPNLETKKKLKNSQLAVIESKRKTRDASEKNAHDLAEKDIGSLTKRDVFMLGLGIYIGEGSKTGHIIRVVNSDPKIISFAIKWFKSVAGLTDQHFNIRLHLYPNNDISSCINFWSKTTGLPRAQFYKPSIDLRKNKKTVRRGTLPFGTAHLSVISRGKKEFGVVLARRINAWIERALR